MISSSGPLGAMYNIIRSALDDTQRYSIDRTQLHVAIMNNNFVDFTALLSSPDLQINALDEEKRTPLHTAAFFGRCDMARALLDRGAACNKRDNKGHTPLHDAVNPIFIELTEQHVLIAGLLLSRGAKASMQASSGFTPLNWMGKFIGHASMSDVRAEYMFSIANLLMAYGAKADESVFDHDGGEENVMYVSKRGRACDDHDDDLASIHTPLTWAVSLELDKITRLFESGLGVDHTAIDAATSDLLQMSILSGPKRRKDEELVAPPSSPMSEDDDLGQSVYGAGL
ncbi:MAG: ankyrin repeat domain-containing protein [Legionellaceae bacterium]|nr:ankyrin repeat domain-containing protein [Legionellaceae bacterium]